MIRLPFFIPILLFLFGCHEQEEIITNALVGEYIIEGIYTPKNDLLYSLDFNGISFNKNATTQLPAIIDRHEYGLREDSVTNGRWAIKKAGERYFIELTSANNYFSGNFNFYFVDYKKNRHLILVLENKDMTIYAVKDAFFYSQNETLVHKAVKYTRINYPEKLPEKFR